MFTIKTKTANDVAIAEGDKEQELLCVGYFECVHFQVRHYGDRTEIALFHYPQEDEEPNTGASSSPISGPEFIVLTRSGPKAWVEAYIENANGKTIDHIKMPPTDRTERQEVEVAEPETAGVVSTEKGVLV